MSILDNNKVLPLEKKGIGTSLDCSSVKWLISWENAQPAKVLQLNVSINGEDSPSIQVMGTYNSTTGYGDRIKIYRIIDTELNPVDEINASGLYLVDLMGCNNIGLYNKVSVPTTVDVNWYLRNDDIFTTSTNLEIHSFIKDYGRRGGIDALLEKEFSTVSGQNTYGGERTLDVLLDRRYKFVYITAYIKNSTGTLVSARGAVRFYFCLDALKVPTLHSEIEFSGKSFFSEWIEVRGSGVRCYVDLVEALEEGNTIYFKIYGVS